ncbi:isopentenyl transferase family protein [Streptomyces sp. NPDC051098]|uniref:isopentenyl transferase family protein n=1 Tax=Streptomyces sp. NPDC051098 TaxID=3155411 RepID=UPI00344633FE
MSEPILHLVLGATGLGKTRLSVALARVYDGCPVLVLDRIQCYSELAIGSARPASDALRGTTRLYLDGGPFSPHGPIAAVPGIDRLLLHLRQCLEDGTWALVIEGGSISLLHELLARQGWCSGWDLRVTAYTEQSLAAYELAVGERVERMLGCRIRRGEVRTLLDELADLWDDPLARKHAAGVLGYEQAIDLCELNGLDPRELIEPTGLLWRGELTALIRAAHLAYGRQQRHALAAAWPALTALTESAELCEI